jgi:hypothetical protein
MKNEVFMTIDTGFSRCVLLFDPTDEGDAFIREVAAAGSFTLIPEGQIPVVVAVRSDDQSALAAYAQHRSWNPRSLPLPGL